MHSRRLSRGKDGFEKEIKHYVRKSFLLTAVNSRFEPARLGLNFFLQSSHGSRVRIQ
jgi:hypothetical protein